MAIPDPIKTNFRTLGKAFDNGDVVLLECRDRNTGAPAYAICAINLLRKANRKPEIEMVPLGLTFNIPSKGFSTHSESSSLGGEEFGIAESSRQ